MIPRRCSEIFLTSSSKRQSIALIPYHWILIALILSSCGDPDGKHKPITEQFLSPAQTNGADAIGYSEVQTIFSQRCTPCHSFYNSYEEVADVVFGGEESLMYKYVVKKQPREMPPPQSRQSQMMTGDERQLIAQWIEAGAPEESKSADSQAPDAVDRDRSQPPEEMGISRQFQVLSLCWSCHGADGISKQGGLPHLAGLSADYIKQELDKYRNEERMDLTLQRMNQIAQDLSADEVEFLASYFSYFPVPSVPVPEGEDMAPSMVRKSLDLMADQACMACHSPDADVEAPNIIGQNRLYLESQLFAFKKSERPSVAMETVAKSLSDDEIRLLSRWLAIGAQ